MKRKMTIARENGGHEEDSWATPKFLKFIWIFLCKRMRKKTKYKMK